MNPTSLDELCNAVRGAAKIRLVGKGTWAEWCAPSDAQTLSIKQFTGVTDFRPDDLTVTAKAGTSLFELDQVVRAANLCLPFDSRHGPVLAPRLGTLGGLVAMNLPHGSERHNRPVRDWCLGMKLVLASGEVCSVGSQVAKSVSGFDLHRTMAGSRGGLAVIAEVTLRLAPVSRAELGSAVVERDVTGPCWIGRTLRTDFDMVVESTRRQGSLLASDEGTCTIWSTIRMSGAAWQVGPGGVREPLPGAQQSQIERNLKAMLDPESKLVEGRLQ